jgi:hypothetical protein
MSNENTVVKGTAFWAQLDQINSYSGKYQVDVSNLSAPAVEALQERGIAVKNKGDDRGFFITCKSKFPIEAADTTGETLQGVQLGNGSGVTAVISSYEWTSPQGKKGVSPNLKKLVVTDLVIYDKDGSGSDTPVDLSVAL